MKKKDKKIEVASLYDLNKQVISQLPEMPQEKIQEQLIQIEKWFSEKEGKYFMLLCREKPDYTLFNFINFNPNTKDKYKDDAYLAILYLKECIKNRGILMSINKAGGDAWEIWIKDFFNKKINMYMLFECGQMVIEV